MARTYRALAALISYPTEALQAAAGEIALTLAEEGLIPAAERAAIDVLLIELTKRDVYDLQERYFALFDRSRTLSLHLFEHVHGESRDRGQAMADLIELYRTHGLEPTAGELPDFLPLFLEFLSLVPEDEARSLLAEPAGILQSLADRLTGRHSTYAAVFQSLATLANAPDAVVPAIEHDDPNDLVALDAAWEEAAVHFGPGEQVDTCGAERLGRRLRAATHAVTAA
ncbi:MAG TPA: nitrate reductase molybdenum cofactor assembly chaperone [Aliidongia sp.]|uniref:nitrate reductase molybdenum cofactor assembly chaperone n=1 Tax=Aliidongia sp. TaxID=1914230 RepID=UPI002DDD655B|nr:nitrate reductase molybdenum cofactor assembly chaperone [Aliidongia sp.]HEV2677143.1 nitrate reductase molybdenum cofactor assembly chaperone [Aliidongia sp.]